MIQFGGTVLDFSPPPFYLLFIVFKSRGNSGTIKFVNHLIKVRKTFPSQSIPDIMKLKKLLSVTFLLTFLTGILAGCNIFESDDKVAKGDVQLQFKTTPSGSSAKTVAGGYYMADHDSLVVDGSNGTLQIDDIRFVIEEFKLEPTEADEEEDTLDTESEEFEAGPFWVDLPLGVDSLSLATSQIQTGIYKELEFNVEDLNLDEEDDEDNEGQRALADSIRVEYPDWPDEASMVLTGSFTPSDGNRQSFKVFANAEIEVEREFEPPLEVTEDNIQEVLSVNINPTKWFLRSDGTVIDLSGYDWDQTQELLEFESEFEEGVEEVEVDEKRDDEEDDD